MNGRDLLRSFKAVAARPCCWAGTKAAADAARRAADRAAIFIISSLKILRELCDGLNRLLQCMEMLVILVILLSWRQQGRRCSRFYDKSSHLDVRQLKDRDIDCVQPGLGRRRQASWYWFIVYFYVGSNMHAHLKRPSRTFVCHASLFVPSVKYRAGSRNSNHASSSKLRAPTSLLDKLGF